MNMGTKNRLIAVSSGLSVIFLREALDCNQPKRRRRAARDVCNDWIELPMAKIYTRTGDDGLTSLLGGRRVRKDELRIEAIGAVDEVNASLGVVRMELSRSGICPPELDQLLAQIQHRLFEMGAELASPAAGKTPTGTLADDDIAELEAAIDRHEADLEPLRVFILPGGSPAASQLHVARGVCRRSERRLVRLAAAEPIRGELLRYMNRLSDLLFVLARAVNQTNRVTDVAWEQRAAKQSPKTERKPKSK
jgi:cob(I)alamin adenosyltransferase